MRLAHCRLPRNIGIASIAALTALCLFMPAAAQDTRMAQPEYVLGVVPQLPPTVSYRNWSPFIQRLGSDVGVKINLRVYQTFTDFENDLYHGRVDLMYMNPYHEIVAHKTQGYIPLVRDGSRKLSGILVVRQDSPLHTLKDLHGKNIAFPHPNAFAASLYMRALLHEQAKIDFTPRYVTTHTNVYRQVLLGRTAAGGGASVTFAKEPPELREQLRTLYETPPVAPHPLSAHPRVPAPLRQAIITAVLGMDKNPEGKRILEAITVSHPVRADYERDYAPLKRLELEKYYDTSVSGE